MSVLLNYEEAAALLRIAPSSLRKKVMLGAIPCVKPYGKHGQTLFDREELEKFIESKRVPVRE